MPDSIPNRRPRYHGDPERNRPGGRKPLHPGKKRKVKLPTTKTEPALIRGAVIAVLGLLASLGVGWAADVDKDTIATITTVLVVVLPLLQAAWTRFAVTANAKVLARVSVSKGTVVAGEAAAAPTGQPLEVTDQVGMAAVDVAVKPSLFPTRDERGESALRILAGIALLLLILVLALTLIR